MMFNRFSQLAMSLMVGASLLAGAALAESSFRVDNNAAPRQGQKIANVMACRGGGAMTVSLSQLPKSPEKLAATITYEKAKTGGTRPNADILPGQCAWVKRPLSYGEPSEMTFITPSNISKLEFNVYDHRITQFEIDPANASNDDEMAQLINSVMTPEMFYVHAVYDDYTREISVTKIGLE